MLSKVLIVAMAINATFAATVPAGQSKLPRPNAEFERLMGYKSDGRIVGGIEAAPHAYPWQVALLSRVGAPTAWCGGSIISDQYVLTAAHCCEGETPSSIKVRVGAHDLRNNEAGAKTVNVNRIIGHRDYNGDTYQNDICLLRLSEKLVLSATVAAAPLADVSDDAPGQVCTISGWGNDVKRNGPAQNARALHSRLREVQQTVVSNAVCHKAYISSVQPMSITPDMLCGAAPGKDSCQGDSGGPFVCRASASAPYKLAGVVSWGYGCADPRYPGAYARVSHFRQWIKDNAV